MPAGPRRAQQARQPERNWLSLQGSVSEPVLPPQTWSGLWRGRVAVACDGGGWAWRPQADGGDAACQEQRGRRGRDEASAAAAVPRFHQIPGISAFRALGCHLAAERVSSAGCQDQAAAGCQQAHVRSGRGRGGDAGAGGSGGHCLQGPAQGG